MTTSEFETLLQQVADKYLNAASTEATENAFRVEVTSLVISLYAAGGMLADRLGPIPKLEDLEIIISRGEHSLSASAIRTTAALIRDFKL